ncbi:MAG: endonuclease/exonuclease/phosphatase family protein [Deltaproteobacteria bacterium]|jgi:endonuclease/exonuclease/phosphatase family metal-dependent hydrolase|nr:endonuclease/exonuclease/phosphatase family protein [Deltaproteobacteria bacterium]MBW2530028.1 endonuclease/exonuclease/phosphatase family protein [Deltaproteobacteria bacterium]
MNAIDGRWHSLFAAAALALGCGGGDGPDDGSGGGGGPSGSVRIAQFNVQGLSTDKLLDPANGQVRAVTEIVARFDPDILCIEELEYDLEGVPVAEQVPGRFDGGAQNAARIAAALNAATSGAPYEHTLITLSNSGFLWAGPDNGVLEFGSRGAGELADMNYGIVSRYPILKDQVRVVTDVAWSDLPDNVTAQMQSEIGAVVPEGYPLFSKALVIAPIDVDGEVLVIVLLHPVPPIIYPTWPYRNHDELGGARALLDGVLPGVDPLPEDARFVLVGDLNADPDDGDSLPGAIRQLLDHPRLVPYQPEGAGTGGNNPQRNTNVSDCPSTTPIDPTASFQLQLDYLMPSATIGEPLDGGVFFPAESADFDLACRGSDHMMLWAELPW